MKMAVDEQQQGRQMEHLVLARQRRALFDIHLVQLFDAAGQGLRQHRLGATAGTAVRPGEQHQAGARAAGQAAVKIELGQAEKLHDAIICATLFKGKTMSTFAILFVMLIVILIAAEVFTNALEHLGEKLKISEGVTGSLFAAVGTALPETMVPLLALMAGTSNTAVNEEIGVGAILGAPLMLATLSTCLMAVAVWKKRGANGHLAPERTGLTRDLNFFLAAFAFSTLALFIPHQQTAVRAAIGFTLVLTYFVYILLTLRASAHLVKEGHGTEAEGKMMLCRLGLPEHMLVILIQLALGLALLVAGAKGFIHGVEEAAGMLGISALLLSLLIIPIATELPEKVNSIMWIRRHKDTLAFGNITGAMVFQGTLLPAIGIMLTPWEPRQEVLAGVVIAFLAALWVRVMVSRGQLKVWHLAINGVMYVTYLVIALS